MIFTVLVEVLLPVGIYGTARRAGVSEVWSLVVAGSVSLLTGAVQWVRRRRIGVLGVVVVAGFGASAGAAIFTADPVVVFMMDPLNNVVVASLVLVMMGMKRPFVARVRRDLSPRPERFDARWQQEPSFRAAHRRASWVWAGGLTLLAVVWTGFVMWLPFDGAVMASRVVGLAGYVAMIGGSEVVVRLGGESP